jgi:hypothetical protein
MLSDAVDALERALAHERPRRAIPGALVAAVAAIVSRSPGEARKRDKKRGRRRKKGKGKKRDDRCKSRHSEKEILKFIGKAAKKYGQSKKAMERVARCESALDPCAVNRSGPYYGMFQFLKSTWKTTPYKKRSIWDPEAQALATAWMWKQGRKNEWACK